MNDLFLGDIANADALVTGLDAPSPIQQQQLPPVPTATTTTAPSSTARAGRRAPQQQQHTTLSTELPVVSARSPALTPSAASFSFQQASAAPALSPLPDVVSAVPQHEAQPQAPQQQQQQQQQAPAMAASSGPSWLDDEEDDTSTAPAVNQQLHQQHQPQQLMPSVTTQLTSPEAAAVKPAFLPPAAAVAVSSSAETTSLRELQEAERQLLAELATLEQELYRADQKTTVIHMQAETDSFRLEAALIAKQRDVENQRILAAKKSEADRAYFQSLETRLEQRGKDELESLRVEYYSQESDRLQRKAESIQRDIGELERTVEKLNEQRALVLLNNTFSPQGVLIAVNDAPTLETKLAASLDLIQTFAKEQLNWVRNNVVSIIRQETTEVVEHAWEARRKTHASEVEQRRQTFAEFLHEQLLKRIEFTEQRQEAKQVSLGHFRQRLHEASEALRCAAKERCQQLQVDVTEKLSLQLHEFQRTFAASMAFMKQKQEAERASDDSVAASQFKELHHRLDIASSIQAKVQQSAKEGLQHRMEREFELLFSETNERLAASKAKTLSAASQGVDALTTRTGELLALVEQLRHRQVQRNVTLRLNASSSSQASSLRGNNKMAEGGREAATAPLHEVLPQEEMELRRKIEERSHVLSDLLYHTTAKFQQVESDRTRCATLRTQVFGNLEDFVSHLHDGRLRQQSEMAQLDVMRAAWEKEHRQMLSAGSVVSTKTNSDLLTAGDNNGDGQHAADVAETHHPYLFGLLTVSQFLSTNFARLEQLWKRNHGDRQALLRLQGVQDATSGEHNEKVTRLWSNLFESVLQMNGSVSSVAEKDLAIAVEAAKLRMESESLAAERAALSRRAEALQHAAQQLNAESAGVAERKERAEERLKQFEAQQMVIGEEQQRLAQCQSDLRHRQAQYYESEKVLSQQRQRLATAMLRGTDDEQHHPHHHHHQVVLPEATNALNLSSFTQLSAATASTTTPSPASEAVAALQSRDMNVLRPKHGGA